MSIAQGLDRPNFLIDSSNRTHGINENFSIQLDIKKNNEYDSVSLIQCSIPKTYYCIDDSNNTFTLRENGSSTTVVIPSGNYNTTNFPSTLKIALEVASLAIGGAGNAWTYLITYPTSTQPDTGKSTYTITAFGGRPYVSASFEFVDDKAHELMGFQEPATVSVNSFNGSSILVSTVPNDFERTKYITIKSDIAHNAGNYNPDSYILARLPVKNTTFGDIIDYNLIQLEDGAKILANGRSNTYVFSIYDDHERILNLNGRDWFLTLFMYKHNLADEYYIAEQKYIIEQRRQEQLRQLELENPNTIAITSRPTIINSIVQNEQPQINPN